MRVSGSIAKEPGRSSTLHSLDYAVQRQRRPCLDRPQLVLAHSPKSPSQLFRLRDLSEVRERLSHPYWTVPADALSFVQDERLVG
jgi:hypothetical protein